MSTAEKIDEALKRIRKGWIAGVVYVVFLCGILGYALYTEVVASVFEASVTLDIVAFSLLTFGVFKRNRFLSVFMLLLFSVGQIIIPVIEKGQLTGGIFGLVFIYLFFRAAQASFLLKKAGYTPNKKLKSDAASVEP
jgi:hypothetical protein